MGSLIELLHLSKHQRRTLFFWHVHGWDCWLQVTKGNDVVITIEKAKTDRNDKPFEDIKIVNIEAEKTS